jgi:hypothetical protein
MGRGAAEAKRVGLGSVATFIGQGKEKGSGDWANWPSMAGKALPPAAVSTRNQGKGVTEGED